MEKHVRLKHLSVEKTLKFEKDIDSQHNLCQQSTTSSESYSHETLNNVNVAGSKNCTVQTKSESDGSMRWLSIDGSMAEVKVENPTETHANYVKDCTEQMKTESAGNMYQLNFDGLMSEVKMDNATETHANCVTCDICKKSFTEELYLKKHIKLNHPIKEEPQTMLNLKESMENNDSGNVKTVECVEELNKSKEDDTGNTDTIECRICGLELENVIEYTKHIEVHLDADTSETEQNNEAGIKTESSSLKMKADAYIKFEVIQKKTKSFSCSLCGKALSSKNSVIEHVKAGHLKTRDFQPEKVDAEPYVKIDVSLKKVKVFTCTRCRYSNATKSNVAEHVKAVHLTKREFLCALCNQLFMSKNALMSHINFLHHTKNPNQCKLCQRSFLKQSYLTQHVAAVHKQRPAFSSEQNMAEHIETAHDKLKHFTCTLCKKSFVSKHSLVKHIDSFHPKLKKGKCKLCDKYFVRKPYLKQHIKLVHEQNCFSCTLCGHTFQGNEELTSHVNAVHARPHPFPCTECNMSFAKKAHMKNHRSIKHK